MYYVFVLIGSDGYELGLIERLRIDEHLVVDILLVVFENVHNRKIFVERLEVDRVGILGVFVVGELEFAKSHRIFRPVMSEIGRIGMLVNDGRLTTALVIAWRCLPLAVEKSILELVGHAKLDLNRVQLVIVQALYSDFDQWKSPPNKRRKGISRG